MAKKVLTYNLSEPLDGARTAKVVINPGDGNLIIDGQTGGEPVLASGALQYLENQSVPTRSMDTRNGQATLAVKAAGRRQPWLHLPWSACNGATEWQVHLNPDLPSALTAHSDGGNVRLDLSGMALTKVQADTGGGNIDVVLPNGAANLSVAAKTGAGNVVVRLPGFIAARVHAKSGLGKVILDGRFRKIDATTYQTLDYDHATGKVEITLSSGAGNVIVKE